MGNSVLMNVKIGSSHPGVLGGGGGGAVEKEGGVQIRNISKMVRKMEFVEFV